MEILWTGKSSKSFSLRKGKDQIRRERAFRESCRNLGKKYLKSLTKHRYTGSAFSRKELGEKKKRGDKISERQNYIPTDGALD